MIHGVLGVFAFCALIATSDAVLAGDKPAPARDHAVVAERAIERMRERTRLQALLWLKPGIQTSAVAAKLPNGIRVVQAEGRLVLVRAKTVFAKDGLQKLRTIAGVAAAWPDHPMVARGKTSKTHTSCGSGRSPASADCAGAAEPLIRLPNFDFEDRCMSVEQCPGSGRTRLWAQERIDADLATRELERIGIRPGTVNVAVVDTGFDLEHNRNLMATISLKIEKGFDESGDPERDEDGHGTMVSGLIGGWDGIGIAPHANLTVYRATEAYSEGSASSAALNLAVRRACEQGNEIINLSWGGLLDEMGIFADEDTEKELIDDLASRGCLVVKAAGNDSFRKRSTEKNNPDDAYLRVDATSVAGRSSFSTPGEISAPGSGVFTLESAHVPQDQRAGEESKCGKRAGRFVNGTSFAAPIVTAVAANVVAVLKTSIEYLTLPPRDKVKLVNRILIGSQLAGTVNALRAVLIAERWAKFSSDANAPASIMTAEAFGKWLSYGEDSVCYRQVKRCRSPGSACPEQACLYENQRASALCSSPGAARIAGLAEDYVSLGNLERATGTLRRYAGSSEKLPPQVSTAIKKLWKGYTARWQAQREIDFGAGVETLDLYLDAERDPKALASAVRLVVGGDSIADRLARHAEFGGDEDFEPVLALLKKYGAKAGLAELEKALTAMVRQGTGINANPASNGKNWVALARLLDGLLADTKFSQIHGTLLKLESQLFEIINENWGTITEVRYLRPLFLRNKARLQELVANAESSSLEALGMMPMAFLLSPQADFVSYSKGKNAFLMKVAKAIGATSAPWGLRSAFLTDRVVSALGEEVGKLAADEKQQAISEFQSLVLQSTSYQFQRGIFPPMMGEQATETDLEKAGANPLLGRELIFRAARNLAGAISQESAAVSQANQVHRNGLVAQFLPYLVADPDTSVPGLLDDLLKHFIQDYKDACANVGQNWDARKEWGYEPIVAILDNETAMERMPENPAWRQALGELMAHAAVQPDRYPESLIIKFKKVLGQPL